MSLYQKYRPTDFDQILENHAEIEVLKSILEKKDRPHVFLFVGDPGCGKTTLARIMAKKLGADELSIHEINSSDNRGIDTARDIIEKIRFMSPSGKPKVFIIDEVHKTSNDFQNAMLKPLEDTPKHVYFFLCTTDPQKLIPAIKTRCQPIKVHLLSEHSLFKLLYRTVKKEGKDVNQEVLKKIAFLAKGSARQALVFLDKIIDLTDEKLILQAINNSDDEEAQTIELCRILLNAKTWDQIASVLVRMKDIDAEKIRYAIMGYMSAVLLKSDNSKAGVILECFSQPTYNSGKNGIILMAYQSFKTV